MLKVLITGSNGQLGSEIKELSDKYNYKFFFTCKEKLNIEDKNKIEFFIDKNKIDAIINCAAYTAVDNAENNENEAYKINTLAVRNLARISKERNLKLIHISTDYVFDGKNYKPYTETDITNPKSIYGKTKFLGEQEMIKMDLKDSIIIRTSWLYSSFGENFVKTMMKLGAQKEVLEVVFDQIGTPTYAKDLAKTILDILPNIQNKTTEVYHYSNEGVLSWYDFAKEIMKMTKTNCKIMPIHSYNFPRPAPRPHFSVLDKTKIKKDFALEIPYWKDGLNECLKKMGIRA